MISDHALLNKQYKKTKKLKKKLENKTHVLNMYIQTTANLQKLCSGFWFWWTTPGF